MPSGDPLSALLALPGVPDAVARVRDACTEVRWHEALRRRRAEVAAESRIRGAWASGALAGAQLPLVRIRNLVRGAEDWPANPDPVDRVVRGAVHATVATEQVAAVVRTAPRQALARLHVAAAAGLCPQEQLGRPRAPGEGCREFVDLGPAPEGAHLEERLAGIVDLLGYDGPAPVLLVAAVLHAEIVATRPFVAGNGVVARAVERLVIEARGLDPVGVVVPEVGHQRRGPEEYLGSLTAYAMAGQRGVTLWLLHCADAVVQGADEGRDIADSVLAGRLT